MISVMNKVTPSLCVPLIHTDMTNSGPVCARHSPAVAHAIRSLLHDEYLITLSLIEDIPIQQGSDAAHGVVLLQVPPLPLAKIRKGKVTCYIVVLALWGHLSGNWRKPVSHVYPKA